MSQVQKRAKEAENTPEVPELDAAPVAPTPSPALSKCHVCRFVFYATSHSCPLCGRIQ